MVYRDGKSGRLYAKKFKVGGVTRDKEYPLFKTHSKSRVFFFAVHDSEKKNSRVLVHLDPDLKRVKEKVIEFDFSWLELQGRAVKGSTLTAHKVDRVVNAPKSEESEHEGKTPPSKAVGEKVSAKPAEKPKAEKKSKSAQEGKTPSSAAPKPLDPSDKEQATFDFKDN